jgi:hypothetical protein
MFTTYAGRSGLAAGLMVAAGLALVLLFYLVLRFPGGRPPVPAR